MKKYIKRSGISILSLVIIFLLVFNFFPGLIIKSDQAITKIRANVKESVTETKSHTWSYLYGGKGDTLVFIHGFPDSKYMWLNYMKYFTENHYVIVPDLPGFGKTMHNPQNEYLLDNTANYLDEFFESLNIKQAHLVGISMGGAIVLKYANTFPEKVKSITSMNAFGISSEKKSRFQKYVDEGYIPFVFKTVEDFDLTMELIFNEPVYIPKPIKKWIVKNIKSRTGLYTKMVKREVGANGWNSMDSILTKTDKPTLFIWGDEEQVFDVSCTKTIEKLMPHAQIEIIESTGHMPIHQKPEVVLGFMIDFLARNSNK